MLFFFFFLFKQKTAYEIYQCDWSSDVCSSDLGQGGAVTVMATDSVTISGASLDGEVPSGLFALAQSETAQAQGGNVTITAGQDIQLTNGASITAESFGLGNAGDILLKAGNLISLTGNSRVTTDARNASGGNITFQNANVVHLFNSEVTSSVRGGPTTAGGDIRINAGALALNSSRMNAKAVEGIGGNIRISGDAILVAPNSSIDASSEKGIDGAVDIEAPIQNLSGAIAPLPQNFQGVATLFSESNGRLLVEVRPEDAPALEKLFVGLPLTKIGAVSAEVRLVVKSEGKRVIDVDVEQMLGAWKGQAVDS